MGWKYLFLIFAIFIISCSQQIEQKEIKTTPSKPKVINMVENLEWLGHASFKITGEKVIYIDPFKIKDGSEKADIILVTHEHFDHCSPEDIAKIQKDDTVIVATKNCEVKGNVKIISPNSEIEVKGIKIETIPAYNINKFRSPGVLFHPKENEMVGYIITVNGKRIYHAGDTDKIPEIAILEDIDIALLPIGGTYTMDYKEAADAANTIKAKLTIPMHYGSIVGDKSDAENFKELVDGEVKVLD